MAPRMCGVRLRAAHFLNAPRHFYLQAFYRAAPIFPSVAATDGFRRIGQHDGRCTEQSIRQHHLEVGQKTMNTLPATGGDRPDEAGYSSSSACTCPRCNGSAYRIHRRFVDLLMSMFITVSRYRCRSMDCGWEGNLRVKRHRLLVRGPW